MELRQLRQLEAQHRDLMRRRRSVELELAGLEASSATGEQGRKTWRRAVSLLTALRRELEQHFALEERAGLLEAATRVAPRLSRRAGRLAHQHAEMNERLARLLSDLLDSSCAPERWARLVEAFASFSGLLLAHEQAEEELVREAFMDDLGGGD